jgi:hypothetical protein
MASDLFLDDEALRKLTGFAHKGKQIEQLRKMRVPFWINGRGQAVVACSAVQGVAPAPAAATKPTKGWQPRVLTRA